MTDTASTTGNASARKLTLLGWALCGLFLLAAVLWDRTDGMAFRKRPILLVLGVYISAALLSVYTLRTFVKIKDGAKLIPIVVAFALAFRLIHLFATPFLEIDAYRYMWDGIVTSHGMSPYEWSPEQARTTQAVVPVDQQPIVALANSTEPIHAIVSKVHFADFTTIYPPVSQAVFAATMWLVPDSASTKTHLIAMKLALVCFDVATILLLLRCLRIVGRNPLWVIAYAWNPLVIKEIANSGHLDSIAVFFVTATMLVVLLELKRGSSFRTRSAIASGGLLACGIGAKLFPLALSPLFAAWLWRRKRVASMAFMLTVTIVGAALMTPMMEGNLSHRDDEARDGLTGFISKWRMNALAFDVVYENARLPGERLAPWYSVVPMSFRESWHDLADRLPGSWSPETKLARIVTLGILAAVYLWILAKVFRRRERLETLPIDAFCVLGVFLFVQPTVNPWYWVWVVPLLCFVNNCGWHVIGASILIYYARFWFKFNDTALTLGDTKYVNVDCFDHLIVWLEYSLFVVSVVAFRIADRKNKTQSKGQTK